MAHQCRRLSRGELQADNRAFPGRGVGFLPVEAVGSASDGCDCDSGGRIGMIRG